MLNKNPKKSRKKRRKLGNNSFKEKFFLFSSKLKNKLKTKKRLIKITIFLFIILLVILLFLRVKFFLGEPLHFRLNPQEINLYLTNNETISQELEINVDNFPTCSSLCSFKLFDINNGNYISIENSTIPFRKNILKNLTFKTPEFGEGILLYRYNIECINNPNILCPSTGERHYQSTFIKIDYTLNSNDKELKLELKPLLINLTDIINNNYLIYNRLLELESNYKKINNKVPQKIHNSLNNSFSILNNNKINLQNLIDETFSLLDLWNVGNYPSLTQKINSTYSSALILNNALKNLESDIIFSLESINTGNSYILDFNKKKQILNNAFNFYSITSNYNSGNKAIYDFYYFRINSQSLRILENELFNNFDKLTISDFNSNSTQLNNISNTLLNQYKTNLKFLANTLYKEIIFLNLNLDILFNESSSNNPTFITQNTSILVSDEFFSKNSPFDFSFLCSNLNKTIKEIKALNKTYFNLLPINNSNLNNTLNIINSTNSTNINNISNTNTTLTNLSNFQKKLDFLNLKLKQFNSFFNYTLLLNNTNANLTQLIYNLELYNNLVCDISSSTNKFFTLKEMNKFNYTINLDTRDYSPLSFNIENKSKLCCVMGECNPCNSNPDNRSLYPIIFVHGHMFNSALSPESSLKAFNLIANELEHYGYVNTGDFDLPLFYEENLINEWSEFTAPVLTRVSYYFINYFDLGISTLQTQKSERIENYALRLNEFISAVLKKTGQNKVNLVAYSMGGLVSREYINIFGENKVNKLITLSTPHKGIFGRVYNVCKLTGSSKECEDMHIDSPFLKRLNQASNIPENIEIHTIGGYGCEMQTDSGIASGDGIVLYNNTQLDYAQNYKIKGNCTDLFQSDLHSKILDPNLYPQIPILIDSILKN